MTKVLVLATSRKTRGGVTAVLKLYEQSQMWQQCHCRWVGTHRDGGLLRKFCYMVKGLSQFLVLLPFYDIVHFHLGMRPSVFRKISFFKIAKLFGKKTVVHLHLGTQVDEVWNSLYQTMFEQCDCGVLLAESIRVRVAEKLERGEVDEGKEFSNSQILDKLKVVYNPCPVITDTAIYEKKNHILFAGTLYEGKGYLDLIRAFAKIAPRHPDWKIVLAGNGEVEKARAKACELDIANQVELLGWVNGEAKHQAFSEAKALCLPSYAEGFPMAVLDAWAYGLPVITTPVGGIPDVAVDGENMLLFNPGDVDALAQKLEMMVSDEDLRSKLAKASRKMAAEKFNLETISSQIAEIYESLF